jgi:hypothetical protein
MSHHTPETMDGWWINDTLYQIYMITLYILGYTARKKKLGVQVVKSTPGNKRGAFKDSRGW